MSEDDSTRSIRSSSFKASSLPNASAFEESITLIFYLCPNCNEYSVIARGYGQKTKGLNVSLLPRSFAKQFPSYVPVPIRTDYEEAFAIVSLSPKASATLSRRCLQGMIRDFWGITKSSLAKEIDALETLIPAAQWRVLNGLRQIGNIGAHMERDINTIIDIEPDEAQKLLKLIELLVEQWYIQRHDQEQLYSDIIGIAEDKRQQRANSN
ncbi:DUF4145 domain-containing protein [Paenibacillus polymyxa]|nr:DUF4145 domain-containing protein [Paenibacillus polymyxa]